MVHIQVKVGKVETVKTEYSVYFLKCPCLEGRLCLGTGRFFSGPISGIFLVLVPLLIFCTFGILDYTGVCWFSPLEGHYNFHSHTFCVYKFLHSPYCYYLSIQYLEISNFQQKMTVQTSKSTWIDSSGYERETRFQSFVYISK